MDDVVELERRMNDGEWLRPGEVAVLLGVGRTKVHGMIEAGQIQHRKKPGSTFRICNPEDIRRLLAESRQVHGGEDSPQ